MALGTLQPLDDIWVSFMNVILCHANIVSPWIGYRKGSLSHRGCHFMPRRPSKGLNFSQYFRPITRMCVRTDRNTSRRR
jgi:hypothetical protein